MKNLMEPMFVLPFWTGLRGMHVLIVDIVYKPTRQIGGRRQAKAVVCATIQPRVRDICIKAAARHILTWHPNT
jgi:hypothetical protein